MFPCSELVPVHEVLWLWSRQHKHKKGEIQRVSRFSDPLFQTSSYLTVTLLLIGWLAKQAPPSETARLALAVNDICTLCSRVWPFFSPQLLSFVKSTDLYLHFHLQFPDHRCSEPSFKSKDVPAQMFLPPSSVWTFLLCFWGEKKEIVFVFLNLFWVMAHFFT